MGTPGNLHGHLKHWTAGRATEKSTCCLMNAARFYIHHRTVRCASIEPGCALHNCVKKKRKSKRDMRTV